MELISYKGGNRAGCGGVIRGNKGEWLGGFAKGVGNCSAFIAELWGVMEGLCIASRMGFNNVELSIDSQVVVVVQAIHTGRVQGSAGCALIKKIRQVLKEDWNLKITYEYREANKVADALANIGCSIHCDEIFYENCPLEIRHILVSDELGNSTPKLVVV